MMPQSPGLLMFWWSHFRIFVTLFRLENGGGCRVAFYPVLLQISKLLLQAHHELHSWLLRTL